MSLIDPSDPIEEQNRKLLKITDALMRRVEEKSSDQGLAYAQFERAALLEAQVRRRTLDLERALDLLHESNAQLAEAKRQADTARMDLADAIETVDGGFGLFGPDDRLMMSNSRFCAAFLDVRHRLVPGLAFRDYVATLSRSVYLSLPASRLPADWAAARLARHGDDQVVFNVALTNDRWIQVHERRTASGGTVILQTDVTDLIRSEREARDRMRDDQARMVRATLDHLNQGVCIFDGKGQLIWWNTRMGELFDLPSEDVDSIVGLPFAAILRRIAAQMEIIGEVDEAGLLDWASQPRARAPLAFEVRRASGTTLSVFAQQMPDRGFVFSFTDVTGERRAAQALAEMNEALERRVEERTLELGRALADAERANASKSRFVAAASHDLLQPLSAAKLFVESMSDRVADEALAVMVDKASLALAGAEQIIEALLNISRLDAGKAAFSVKAVPLDRVLGPLEQELRPAAQAKGLALGFVSSSLTVQSDPAYLRRIVQNLATNAVRYTDTGRVLIGVRRLDAGRCRIEVWDTGPGISPEHREVIFQEFKQLAPAQGGAQGLGLGLAIVERACAGLGHALDLRSEPGRGSCFSVTLPLASAVLPVEESARGAAAQARLDGQVVLLVENDAQMARAMSLLIEGWGGDVIAAASGESALALLEEIELTPDAALLDYQLGEGMDGIDLAAAIRARHGAIPVAIVSADRTEALGARAKAAGLTLLHKPIDRAALARVLGTAG